MIRRIFALCLCVFIGQAELAVANGIRYQVIDLGDIAWQREPKGFDWINYQTNYTNYQPVATAIDSSGDVIVSNSLFGSVEYSLGGSHSSIGPRFGRALALNSRGTIVGGGSIDNLDDYVPYRWDAGSFKLLTVMAGGQGAATGINTIGDIIFNIWAGVGPGALFPSGACGTNLEGYAVVISSGKASQIPAPNTTYVQLAAAGINDSGAVVGTSFTCPADKSTATQNHAFLYSNSSTTDLSSLSSACCINASGQIAGGTDHAALYNSGQTKDLGTLGGATSWSLGLNDRGDVVGWSTIFPGQAKGERHAFLYTNNTLEDLNDYIVSKGWLLYSANAINNNGYICGDGLYEGIPHAFLLLPRQ